MAIYHRIYSDFFMPSRINEYDEILAKAIGSGYEVISVKQFYTLLKTESLKTDTKYLILRHDIDTDVKLSQSFYEVESKYNVSASYYFRQSTLDYPLMKMISSRGGEVGYHYEEIASFAKENKIKSPEILLRNIEEIRRNFKDNFFKIQDTLGGKLNSVASHGDFVNRKIKLPNFILINDEVRKNCGIEFEAYDNFILSNISLYISDFMYPHKYIIRDMRKMKSSPYLPDSHRLLSSFRQNKIVYKTQYLNPSVAIEMGEPIIHFLTHPRHWRSNIPVNLKDTLFRIKEGVKYRM